MNFEELKQKWEKLIKNPDWHLFVIPEIGELKKQISEADRERFKEEIYDFFEEHLEKYDIALGQENSGYFDSERKPIDAIVIHHTSNAPGMSPSRLSAIELFRLYAPYFINPSYDNDQPLKGQPIFSGHIRNNRQVFWPYHWLIRTDGRAVRLLEDKETGWHAGNWEMNCRSIAVVFDNDYENSRPSDIELRAAADLIRNNYGSVDKKRIFGHREINPATACPSNLFLSGWKQELIDLI